MMDREFWKAAGIRALRTFIQVILAVWTAGQLITDVDWKFLLLSAFSSAVYSMLTSILAGLPEVDAIQGLKQLEELRPYPRTDNSYDQFDEIGIPVSEEDDE